jgi:hypothetical protein
MSSLAVCAPLRPNFLPIVNVIHAVQFIRKMRGGSQPALIRCSDDKLYVVKFLNNQQGPNVLANEVLGNELLNAFDLPTPKWKAVFISNRFLKANAELSFETPQGRSPIVSGLHFGSEFLGDERTGQVYEWLPGSFSDRITNPEDFLGIHILDLLANHCDHRQPLFTTADGNASFRAVFIDNGHLFGGPEWKLRSRPGESLSLDRRFHINRWPEEIVEGWISRFERTDGSSLFDVVQNVPRFWYSGDISQVIGSFVHRLSTLRAVCSEELIRKRVIPKLTRVDHTNAKLSLHRFELSPRGNLKRWPASCVAS